MELKGRHIVVTGGASGIGLGLAERFAKEGARGIVIADRDGEKAQEAAERVGGLAVEADLSRESGVLKVIAAAQDAYGPIDLYCSNAGVSQPLGGEEIPDEGWQLHWNLHVMSHVWAARALLPGMIERGEGYLLNTASAAGLLMTAGATPYTVSKHAAVAFAESLAVQHAGKGVRFSCLCPAYVETPIVATVADTAVGRAVRGGTREVSVAEVAEIVVEALREERFLILTHPEVTQAMVLRAQDPAAYLAAMTKRWAAVNES
jgi:NAD(P)-dependent dehydrogenase (short-subunit alcohol dehydrogenase family)